MSTAELLKELASLGISLQRDGESVTVQAPKGVMTPDLADRIRESKAELIEALREITADTQHIPVGENNLGTLSLAQERIWTVDQLAPHSAQYNLAGVWRLEGAIDFEALHAAVEDLAERHHLLRARISIRDSRPVLRTPEDNIPPLEIQDFRAEFGVPTVDAEDRRIREWMERAAAEPFSLVNEPPIRIHILRIAETQSLFFVVVHNVIWDAWCFDILLRDLGALYRGRTCGEPAALPELNLRYEDFAVWQRQNQLSTEVQNDLGYWQEQLQGHLEKMALPADSLRLDETESHPGSHQGTRINYAMPERVSNLVSTRSRKLGVTPYMIMLAGFALLMSRLSGRKSVIVTTPVRSRDRPELEDVIGPFTNNLFLRIDPGEYNTFAEFLIHVRDVVSQSFAHDNVPFDLVAERLNVDPASSCLFQVDFSFQNATERVESWGDLSVRPGPPFGFHTTHSEVGLWVLSHQDGTLNGAIDYSTDLFHKENAEHWLHQLFHVLEEALNRPDEPLKTLALDPASFVQRLDQKRSVSCVHEKAFDIFDALSTMASHAPERVAVKGVEISWTLDEVLSRSEVAARRLKAHVKGGQGVAIPRSLQLAYHVDILPLVLGAIRAGVCLHVSDDTALHENHVRLLYQGGAHLHSPRGVFDLFEGSADCVAFDLDSVATVLKDSSEGIEWSLHELTQACAARLSLEDSNPNGGSTLVALEHLDLSWLVEVLFLLLSGKEVELCTGIALTDEYVLAERCRQLGSGSVVLDSATFVALDEVLQDDLEVCFDIPLSGLTRRALLLMRQAGRKCRTTIVSGGAAAMWELVGAESKLISVSPDSTVFVTSKCGRNADIGVEGSLALVSQDGVFMQSHQRARWLPSGRLELRGIEADVDFDWLSAVVADHLLELTGLNDVHVSVRANGTDTPSIIVWAAVAFGRERTYTELHDTIKAVLPMGWRFLAMILEHLPRLRDGQVDERRLLVPGSDDSNQPFEAPRPGAEALLAETWERHLDVSQVSAHDNFADLGGTSLQAVRVLVELQQQAEWHLEPRLIFFQTLRQLADHAPVSVQSHGRERAA